MDKYQQKAVYYAHAGAGELHLRPILNLKKSEDVSLFRKITTETALLVKKYQGSFSGEHGDGIVRAEFIPLMIGETNYQLLRRIKKSFDPNNVFNKGKKGVVLVITIGTGIGSGLFYNGKLIPNLEIGKLLHKDGEIIEFFCADSIRKKEELTLEEWALRFDILLQYIKTIFSPNLIILGGGISKKYDKFKQYLNTDVKIKVAKFKNNAGIIGAAMYASKKINK